MNCKPATAGRQLRSLRDVAHAYIKTHRKGAARELRFFAVQRTLADAIRKASLCELPSGKRHCHQRRIPSASLAEANRRLQSREKDIQGCRSFADLHALVQAGIDPIHMVGALTVYDVAHRIGAKLGLDPEDVYLHAGTAEGTRALVAVLPSDRVDVRDLPPAFRALKPYEIEDCLCIYKKDIRRIVRQERNRAVDS